MGFAAVFERVGEAAGVVVVDDYAYNPAKVRAAVATGRGAVEAGGGRRRLPTAPLLPHARLRCRVQAALAPADVVVVTDVYAAREDPPAGRDRRAGRRRREGVRAGVQVEFVPALAMSSQH